MSHTPNQIFGKLNSLPGLAVMLLCIMLIAAVGYIEYTVTHFIVGSIFFLLPISVGAWFSGKYAGWILVAIASAVCVFNEMNVPEYANTFYVFWNAGVKICVFAFVNYLVSALREFSGNLEQNVNTKTRELQREIDLHKHTTEALMQSEKKYRHVVENAIEFIYATNINGNFTYGNNAALKASEYTKEEFETLNFYHMVEPSYRKKLINFYIRQYLERQHATYYEFPFVTKSGKIKWLGQNALLTYENGQITGFYIIARDITDRKTTQNALEQSEIKFRNLAKTAPVALTRMNVNTSSYEFVNDEFIRQSGYTQYEFENLTSEQLVRMIHPDDRERVFNTYKSWQDEGFSEMKRIDYRIINKSGQLVWLDTYIYCDRDDKGEITSINQIAMDVTEQRMLQESISESDERYKAFIAHSAEGIYRIELREPIDITLPPDEIVAKIYEHAYVGECNLVFVKMYGCTEIDELLGKDLTYLHGTQINEQNAESFKYFIRSGFKINNAETVEFDKNGNKRFFINNAIGIVEEGKLIRIWGTQIDITEQREIQEMNRKLSQAVEQSSAAIAIMDNTGKVEYVNKKFIEITEFEQADVIGTRYQALSKEVDIDGIKQNLVEFLNNGNEWTGEFLSEKKNGEQFWEYIRISPIKDKFSNVTHLIALTEDITEQKLAEEAVRKSEERYRAFIAQSSEGIYRMELEVPLKITASLEEHARHFSNYAYLAECNDVMARMYGFETADEVVGVPIRNLLGMNSQAANHISFESFIKSGYKVHNSETRERDKEGKIRYFLNNGIGIIENGYLYRIWGTQRDITELRGIQDQIRKLSRAVEQSPYSVVIVNTEGKIEYTNPKFEELTGFKQEDVLNMQPNILLKSYVKEEHYNDIWDTLKSGSEWKGEFYNEKKNGDHYWEYAILSPIKDDEGNLTHFVYIKEDITPRKTVEIELIETMQKAEEASKAKSEFLANMSHEIRTPMNGIVGMTQLLGLTSLSEEQREYIDMIRYSSDILLKIINDILDFSKIESGNMNFNEKSFNVKDLVYNTCKIFKTDAEKKNLSLKCHIDEKIDYHVIGDQYRVNQILINIINNAIKFTQKGGIDVKLYETLRTNGDVTLRFEVTDTGIGIPKEKFNRLFESFTQLENPYDKQYMGTGLGLSIVKKLVDLMHGEITLESEPMKGSTFAITLTFRLVEKNQHDNSTIRIIK